MVPSFTIHGVPHFSRFLREAGLFPTKPIRLLSTVLLGSLVLLGAGDDSARVDRLGHQMMCVCGCNQILLECNHVGCTYSTRMRNELTAAVDHGDSDNTILQSFIRDYGTIVLAVPTNTGFNRLAWIMPYLALVIGITLVVFIVWAWRKRPLAIHTSVPASVRGQELDRFREQARKETDL
jgi:cytochrome c-type biogenesis protein CcmH/NrfF